MKVFVLNISRRNWQACIRNKIFGIKAGALAPAMEEGDLLLARILKDSSNEYGVKGLWYFVYSEPVTDKTFVPWKDGKYSTIIHFEPLILEFKRVFSEEFKGWESTKVRGLAQIRLNASVVALKPTEARDYLRGILSELKDELNVRVHYRSKEINLKTLLEKIANEFDRMLEGIQPSLKSIEKPRISHTERISGGEIVGPRIDTPILNYAPLNELGVVLLFGYYMHELGFSHMEQIRTEFPDAIGMRRLQDGRLQRVRIEFEYESKNFERHGHDPSACDVIVCWVHNWKDCPPNIQVIELKSFIENMSKR